MQSEKTVQVELEEIATVEEQIETEETTPCTAQHKRIDEENVYSSLTNPAEDLYGLPSNTRYNTVNKVNLCIECDNGWRRFENSCYFLSEDRLTWQKSREQCQKKGGDLAIITNQHVQEFLSNEDGLHYWIGLSHKGTSEWMWVNNTVLTVSYWNTPAGKSYFGECGLIATNEPAEASWQPAYCKLYSQYICQKI
ncbi:hypothetical protein DNTS_032280 [Danionella cerebrum]|uniref:C-type lectin domain-containing protein n=1 Tax=Danionella cerebrum TaxID=2873325 RepID=A0A553RHT5_9TELE|nr:hypothetical protein DNTS_032280 [Danionella translucida]TRZ01728.1 hypothetical protein DNTS_032280 [Danionella translucida]